MEKKQISLRLPTFSTTTSLSLSRVREWELFEGNAPLTPNAQTRGRREQIHSVQSGILFVGANIDSVANAWRDDDRALKFGLSLLSKRQSIDR